MLLEQVFKEITQKIIPNLLRNYSLEKWVISFYCSAENLMKPLLIICSKSAKVTSKQCSRVISVNLFCQRKLFQVIHIIRWLFYKLFVILNKLFVYLIYHFTNVRTKYTFSAFRLHKVSTLNWLGLILNLFKVWFKQCYTDLPHL